MEYINASGQRLRAIHGDVNEVPTKVSRTALQNAASITSLMLTTGAAVADVPEDDDKGGAPDMGGIALIRTVGAQNPGRHSKRAPGSVAM